MAVPNYSISQAPWLTAEGNMGAMYAGIGQRSRQLADTEQNQEFDRGIRGQELDLEKQQAAQRNTVFQQQVQAASRKFAAQQNYKEAIERIRAQVNAGTLAPDKAQQAASLAAMQFVSELGEGGTGMAAAIRGMAPPKPAPMKPWVGKPGEVLIDPETRHPIYTVPPKGASGPTPQQVPRLPSAQEIFQGAPMPSPQDLQAPVDEPQIVQRNGKWFYKKGNNWELISEPKAASSKDDVEIVEKIPARDPTPFSPPIPASKGFFGIPFFGIGARPDIPGTNAAPGSPAMTRKYKVPSTAKAAPPSSFKSPDDVKAAVKSGKLTLDEATKILQSQFGFEP